MARILKWNWIAVYSGGIIRCLGSDESGNLGDDETIAKQSTPVQVAGITNAVSVSGGFDHSCALLADGKIKCWGYNRYGQVGDGRSLADHPTPVEVYAISDAAEVCAGTSHSCARLNNGTIRCWGRGADGQIGHGDTPNSSPWPWEASGITTAKSLSCGGHHTCALLQDGTVKCWGDDSRGQLGNDATLADQSTPVSVAGLSNVVALSGGYHHHCALLASGAMKCWGRDDGLLGNDTAMVDQPTPVSVSGLPSVKSLVQSHNFTNCVLDAGSNLYCWGNGLDGTIHYFPTRVEEIGPVKTAAVDAGFHACAIAQDDTVWCWGSNRDGQFGSPEGENVPPRQVIGF